MRITPVIPPYKAQDRKPQPNQWLMSLHYKDFHLINPATGEKKAFKTLEECWKAKEQLESK